MGENLIMLFLHYHYVFLKYTLDMIIGTPRNSYE